MWLSNDVIAAVDRAARIFYVDRDACRAWNAHRRKGELRLLTGWAWETRDHKTHQQGMKTKTVCYGDAWYRLVAGQAPPAVRVISKANGKRKAA